MIGLHDISCAQRPRKPVTEVKTDVIQCSEWLPALSDDDVTHLLRGLEETFSVSEVEELLKGTEVKTDVIQCSEWLPALSDDDVTHLLRGLEETFSVSEVEELLKGLEGVSAVGESGEETPVISESGDCYVDNEVRAVMSMDIDDFIV